MSCECAAPLRRRVFFRSLTLPQSPEHAAAGSLTADPAALQSRIRRESILLLALLACGFFVMPLLIWLIGQAVLGPYAHGGPFALMMDFFVGLRNGSPAYWAVVIGPYGFIQLFRLLWWIARRTADRSH